MTKRTPQRDRILVAYDASSNARRGLDRAVRIAQAQQGFVHLVHGIESTFGLTSPKAPELAPLMQVQIQRNMEEALYAAAEGRLPRSHVHAEVVFEDIVEAILRIANEHPTTLVVVGSHGDVVSPDGPRIGHVPEELSQRCPCSVLVVRPTYQIVDSKALAQTPEPPCRHCLEAQRRLDAPQALCAAHEQQALPYPPPLRSAPLPGIEKQRQEAWVLP